MPRQRQSEPRSLTRLPAVRQLGKLLEEPRHFVGRDADPGVLYFQAERRTMRSVTLP